MSKIKIETTVKIAYTGRYEVDEEKLRETFRQYGYDWDADGWDEPRPDEETMQRILDDLLGNRWWEDALSAGVVDELEVFEAN